MVAHGQHWAAFDGPPTAQTAQGRPRSASDDLACGGGLVDSVAAWYSSRAGDGGEWAGHVLAVELGGATRWHGGKPVPGLDWRGSRKP